MAEITYHHRLALESYGVAKDKLPADLKSAYNAVEMTISSYLKNPVDDKLKTAAEHDSAKLGHKIMDWIEKELPERKPIEKPAATATPPVEQKKVEQKAEQPKTEQPKTEKPATTTPPVQQPTDKKVETTVAPPVVTEVKKEETVAPAQQQAPAEQKAEGGNVEQPKEEKKKSGGLFDFFKI